MLWYAGKRFLQMIPVFFGATFLIYFMVFAVPGDPIAALYGDHPPAPGVIETIRAEYNLDQPFLGQTLKRAAHGAAHGRGRSRSR